MKQILNEVMTAGYHKVLLDRYGITAEITSTSRAGFHRWTFANDGVRISSSTCTPSFPKPIRLTPKSPK